METVGKGLQLKLNFIRKDKEASAVTLKDSLNKTDDEEENELSNEEKPDINNNEIPKESEVTFVFPLFEYLIIYEKYHNAFYIHVLFKT